MHCDYKATGLGSEHQLCEYGGVHLGWNGFWRKELQEEQCLEYQKPVQYLEYLDPI